MKASLKLLVAVLGSLVAATSQAATECIIQATTVAFGVYSSSSNKDSTGTVRVGCRMTSSPDDDTITYSVSLLAGGNGGTIANRRMSNGTSNMSYQLYNNSGRTTVWGDGLNGTARTSGSVNVGTTTSYKYSPYYTIYGRIPLGQSLSPGSYTDTVVISVTFNLV